VALGGRGQGHRTPGQLRAGQAGSLWPCRPALLCLHPVFCGPASVGFRVLIGAQSLTQTLVLHIIPTTSRPDCLGHQQPVLLVTHVCDHTYQPGPAELHTLGPALMVLWVCSNHQGGWLWAAHAGGHLHEKGVEVTVERWQHRNRLSGQAATLVRPNMNGHSDSRLCQTAQMSSSSAALSYVLSHFVQTK
jgi:hypothetical protein